MKKYKTIFGNLKYSVNLLLAASKTLFVLNFIMSIVVALLPYLPLILWKYVINNLTDYVESNSSEKLLIKISIFTVLYCISILFEHCASMIERFVSYRYTDAVEMYLDDYVVDKMSSVELAFYDSSSQNDMLNTVISHLRISTEEMVSSVLTFITGVISFSVAIGMILTLNIWILPIVIVLSIPSILQWRYRSKNNYEFDKKHEKEERKLQYYKNLFFGSAREELRLYGACEYFEKKYEDQWNSLKNEKLRLKTKNQFTWLLQYVCLTLIELFAYIFALSEFRTRTINAGDVLYYVSVANRVRDDFVKTVYTAIDFLEYSNEVDDIRNFMNLKPSVEESGTKKPPNKPAIEFKNVSFKYPDTEEYILKDCSFKLEYGKKIGLVGLNGAGKSTIIKLLCRFYDPNEGEILINGINVKEYDITEYRTLFGVLFQDYIQYSFSLRDNIALSNIWDRDNTQRIYDACQKSHTSDFIGEWENGIDTQMTKRFDSNGKELSGGQWQRVALARAFFRNASIILLDEPSAALDPLAEHQIFEDFSKISKGKSAILISHRLSSITLADKILVLEDGHIIEQGTHRDLIEKNGRYAYLFNLQASKYV